MIEVLCVVIIVGGLIIGASLKYGKWYKFKDKQFIIRSNIDRREVGRRGY